MKKVVLNVQVFDEKIKQKAMKAVSGLEGLESVEMNMKDKKMTVIGDIDPVTVVAKLRKLCPAQILTVGPAKEEKKKDEPKKEAPKKEEPKKADDKSKAPPVVYSMPYYHQYQPPPMDSYYYKPVVEEEPHGCVIC